MQIIDFTKEMIPDAVRLILANYEEERHFVPALPPSPVLPPLEYFATNGLAAAAVENGKLLGFLGGFDPWKPVYCTPDTAGVYSPLYAHAVQMENRLKIWQRLYQAAGEKWAQAGAASHAVSLYAHDVIAQEALYLYGFGSRCTDLIRSMTAIIAPAADFQFAELPHTDSYRLRPLRTALAEHLSRSPAFMLDSSEALTTYLNRKEATPTRIFTALYKDAVIAYMEVEGKGETFASCTPGTANICGAYCLPEYRGTGAAPALLTYLIHTLQQEGYVRLGVDCETFNPTAMGFWNKYFTPYTRSVVRRIDENAVLL